jgi:hypothetical protein
MVGDKIFVGPIARSQERSNVKAASACHLTDACCIMVQVVI